MRHDYVPLEGDYIETSDGLFFTVKGLFHPRGFVIAYLRYIPDPNGDRKRGFCRYRRVYDITETNKFLLKHYPRYLNYIESKGLKLQSIPINSIDKVYKPKEKLKTLLKICSSNIENITVKFASVLSKKSRVTLNNIGVSGSVLLELTTPSSDVDLIVYGKKNGFQIYEALKNLIESEKWIESYDNFSITEIVKKRWGDTILNLRKMKRMEARKALHGLVDGIDYFIRLVMNPKEIEEEITSKYLGNIKIRAKVKSNKLSIFTPCIYEIENCLYQYPSNGPEVTELVSYRGKFTEQVAKGDTIEVKGALEEISYINRKIFRIMLGGKGDYLINTCLIDQK